MKKRSFHNAEVLESIIGTGEAAQRYHYSRRTITLWCQNGYLLSKLIEGRYVIYRPSLEMFLLERRLKK
jgi:hypothetical protein